MYYTIVQWLLSMVYFWAKGNESFRVVGAVVYEGNAVVYSSDGSKRYVNMTKKKIVQEEASVYELRNRFLAAICDVEEKDSRFRVLHDLRDNVLPYATFKTAPVSHFKEFEQYGLPILLKMEDNVKTIFYYALTKNLIQVKKTRQYIKAINEWLVAWNLPCWVLEQADHTLWLWSKGIYSPQEDPLSWGPLVSINREFGLEAFKIEDGYNWDMNAESKGKAKERILADIERRLDEYLEAYEQAVADAGFVSLELRKPIHFEWLVRYQVQGWSQDRIAREYDVGKDTVNKALHDKAELLGIELRRNPNIKTYR